MNISSKRRSDRYPCNGPRKIRTTIHKDNGLIKPTAAVPSLAPCHIKDRGFRNKLQFLLEAIKKLDVVFEKVECYGQEIPCIRSVRELTQRLKVQLGNEYGAFNRVLKELGRAKIGGIARVGERVEKLRGIVNEMASDGTASYIENLEDVRQCLGEMSGLVEIILNVEYGKKDGKK